MKTIAISNYRRLAFVAILASLIAAGSISAFAVPKAQVLRVSDGMTQYGSSSRTIWFRSL